MIRSWNAYLEAGLGKYVLYSILVDPTYTRNSPLSLPSSRNRQQALPGAVVVKCLSQLKSTPPSLPLTLKGGVGDPPHSKNFRISSAVKRGAVTFEADKKVGGEVCVLRSQKSPLFHHTCVERH